MAILVRQQALHCSLAAQIQQTLGSKRDPYASNWLERLRQLKRIKERVLKESENSKENGNFVLYIKFRCKIVILHSACNL